MIGNSPAVLKELQLVISQTQPVLPDHSTEGKLINKAEVLTSKINIP